MKLYKDKTNPLVEVAMYDLEHGVTYVIEDGKRARYNEKDNSLDVIQSSVLVMGEFVEDLTDKQLKLYWTLMNNKNK